MKSLLLCTQLLLIVSVISCGRIAKRQANQPNLENLQHLLQELEKANVNINEISQQVNQVNKNNVNPSSINKEKETPVRDALNRLFGAFQQMASAYVGVLTSVGKSIGLPTIGVQYMQSSPATSGTVIGVKQIQENMQQFQESVQEVSKSINNFFTRQSPVEPNVVGNQVRKFMRLWSAQLQEISDQVTRSFGGLQSEGSSITIPLPFLDFFQNMMRVFEETFSDITQRVTRIFSGPTSGGQQPNQISFLEESKPSQMDFLKEFKNLLELIQKRMKSLSQQLEGLISTSTTDSTDLKAEHKSPLYL